MLKNSGTTLVLSGLRFGLGDDNALKPNPARPNPIRMIRPQFLVEPDFIEEPDTLRLLGDEARTLGKETNFMTAQYGKSQRCELHGYLPLERRGGVLKINDTRPLTKKIKGMPTLQSLSAERVLRKLGQKFLEQIRAAFPDAYDKLQAAAVPLLDYAIFSYTIPPNSEFPGFVIHQDDEFVNSAMLTNPDLELEGGEVYLSRTEEAHMGFLEIGAPNTMVAFRDDGGGDTWHGVRRGVNRTEKAQNRDVVAFAINKKTCGLEPLEE